MGHLQVRVVTSLLPLLVAAEIQYHPSMMLMPVEERSQSRRPLKKPHSPSMNDYFRPFSFNPTRF